MTTCSEIRPYLSALIDGALADADRRRVAGHLEACAACRGMADDLARVREAAEALGPVTPPDHLWLEIAGQIRIDAEATDVSGPARRPPHAVAGWVQWAGLAAALVLATAGVSFVQQTIAPARAPAADDPTVSADVVAAELGAALAHYETAIAELERMTAGDDATLDPAVTATLEDSLALLDRAIADSRQALAVDPTNEPARASLVQALRQKVGLLQTTVTLMNELGRDPGDAGPGGAGGRSSV